MIEDNEPTPIAFPHPTSNKYKDEEYVGISILVTEFEMMQSVASSIDVHT